MVLKLKYQGKLQKIKSDSDFFIYRKLFNKFKLGEHAKLVRVTKKYLVFRSESGKEFRTEQGSLNLIGLLKYTLVTGRQEYKKGVYNRGIC